MRWKGESRSIHQSLFLTHSADTVGAEMLYGCLLSSLEIKALVADKKKKRKRKKEGCRFMIQTKEEKLERDELLK